MRLRPASRQERHIESLARTAQLEIGMGVGDYADTLAQMYDLISQLEDARKKHRAAEDLLIDQLRSRLGHLEAVVHRREEEYDRLQERFCVLTELHALCQS